MTSNLPELPAERRSITTSTLVLLPVPGYFDHNIFVFVNTSQWAVGRCTGPNNMNTGAVGLCTLSDGFGPLAGFTARINVTYRPGGNGALLPGMERTASIPCREDKPGLTESGCGKDSAAWRRDRTRIHRGSGRA